MVPLIGSRFNTEYAFTKINREVNETGEVCIILDDRAIIITMKGNYKQYQIESQTPNLVQQSVALMQVVSKSKQ